MVNQSISILLFFFLYSILIVGSVILLYQGLRDPHNILQKQICKAIGLLLLACAGFFLLASIGELGTYIAVLAAIPIIIITITSGLLLSRILPRGRKSLILLVLIGFPIMFFISVSFGYLYTPTLRNERDGQKVVQALDEYHRRNGKYPATLDQLRSDSRILFIEKPPTIWGWLYTASQDDYVLGFVNDVDKFGYWVCIYRSHSSKWKCIPESEGPFTIKPTPGTYTPNFSK